MDLVNSNRTYYLIKFKGPAPTKTPYDLVYDGTDQILVQGPSDSACGTTMYFIQKEYATPSADAEGWIDNIYNVTGKDAGSYLVWYKMAESDKYAETGPTYIGIVPIQKRSVTIQSASTSKIYDGIPLTYKSASPLFGSFVSGEGVNYSFTGCQTDAGTSNNTFSYTFKDGTNPNNYTITKEDGTLTVLPAMLTATYAGESITYGETPVFQVKVIGFVNGETEQTAAEYVAPTINYPITQTGIFMDVTPSGGSAKNYTFFYTPGYLDVKPANQIIQASDMILALNNSQAIGATTNGDGTLSYSITQGDDVISVDENGLVTALKDGEATILISASATTNYNAAQKSITINIFGNGIGDVNHDSSIDMKDVLALRIHLIKTSYEIDTVAADVNKDTFIDMKDVLLLRKHIANIVDITTL